MQCKLVGITRIRLPFLQFTTSHHSVILHHGRLWSAPKMADNLMHNYPQVPSKCWWRPSPHITFLLPMTRQHFVPSPLVSFCLRCIQMSVVKGGGYHVQKPNVHPIYFFFCMPSIPLSNNHVIRCKMSVANAQMQNINKSWAFPVSNECR